MNLTSTDRILVGTCAEIIAGNRPANEEINLYGMVHRFHVLIVDIVATLAEHVESLSEGKRTVRLAKHILFADRVRGAYLYMASCNVSNPELVIKTMTDDVQLVGLGPYARGFDFPAMPASAQAIAAARAKDEEADRQRAVREQAEMQVQQYNEKLVRILSNELHYRLNRPMLSDAQRAEALQIIGKTPTLESIATACICIGTSLDSLDTQART